MHLWPTGRSLGSIQKQENVIDLPPHPVTASLPGRLVVVEQVEQRDIPVQEWNEGGTP
ncbi:MAG TPA: hypothetical protein VMO26_15370 [Vicinamibacterales bacterium]|nr:hypothetical protein [Vicinamibacterales bacterium]